MNRNKGVDVAVELQDKWNDQTELRFEGGEKNYVEVYVTLPDEGRKVTPKQLGFMEKRRIYHSWKDRFIYQSMSLKSADILIQSALEYRNINLRLHFN